MPSCSKRRRGGTINKYAQLPPGDAWQLVQENVRDLVTNKSGEFLAFGTLAALRTSAEGSRWAIRRRRRALKPRCY
jgi:hypothetical protein